MRTAMGPVPAGTGFHPYQDICARGALLMDDVSLMT